MSPEPGFIPPHGHHRELLSCQKAEVIDDLAFRFCERFLKKGDRTIDPMVQTTRSGKRNFIEGRAVSGTSREMELKFTHVARDCRATPGLATPARKGLPRRTARFIQLSFPP